MAVAEEVSVDAAGVSSDHQACMFLKVPEYFKQF